MATAFVSAAYTGLARRSCCKSFVCDATVPGLRRSHRRRAVSMCAEQQQPSQQSVSSEDPAEKARLEKQKEIERLRAAEKFIEIDEGKYECSGCGYVYEPKRGEFLNSVRAGTAFEDLPENFTCPSCKTPKARFFPKKTTIAGFAENQQYGFGTNSLTAGQKNGLIFGGLFVMFLLLLSGYALN